LEHASYQVEKLHTIAEHSPDQLSVITSLAELETHLADRAAGSKVIGGILGIEGRILSKMNCQTWTGLKPQSTA